CRIQILGSDYLSQSPYPYVGWFEMVYHHRAVIMVASVCLEDCWASETSSLVTNFQMSPAESTENGFRLGGWGGIGEQKVVDRFRLSCQSTALTVIIQPTRGYAEVKSRADYSGVNTGKKQISWTLRCG